MFFVVYERKTNILDEKTSMIVLFIVLVLSLRLFNIYAVCAFFLKHLHTVNNTT